MSLVCFIGIMWFCLEASATSLVSGKVVQLVLQFLDLPIQISLGLPKPGELIGIGDYRLPRLNRRDPRPNHLPLRSITAEQALQPRLLSE